mgnify:CR=1 FL=1
MAASYKKLFKLLIDREMKSKELAARKGKPRNACKNEKRRRFGEFRRAYKNLHGTWLYA